MSGSGASRPVFVRGSAWYRLLRHWASLRFNDTEGVSPGSFSQRARGVHALLTRSKTTRVDKAVGVLPLFVSHEAWVAEEWLAVGLQLCSFSPGST